MKVFVPTISHIVCTDKQYNIGIIDKDTNQYHMPWGHTLKTDLKRFKELTQNNIVLMGSNTYKSIGKPLPNRINIVVSRSSKYLDSDSLYIRNTLDEALTLAEYFAHKDKKDIFIIGGSSIYKQTEHLISKAYITTLDVDYTYRPFKFKNYEFIKYDTSYLSFFTKQSVLPYTESNTCFEAYFTTWVRRKSDNFE